MKLTVSILQLVTNLAGFYRVSSSLEQDGTRRLKYYRQPEKYTQWHSYTHAVEQIDGMTEKGGMW